MQICNDLISWLYVCPCFFSVLVRFSFCVVKVKDECIYSNVKKKIDGIFQVCVLC